MIKKIIKCLEASSKVSDWLIEESITNTNEAFYVLEHLETTRSTNTTEYKVTIYNKFTENNHEYLGSSSFILSHKVNNKTIEKMIADAVYASSYVKNEVFEIVKGEKKRSWKEKELSDEPFSLLDKIALTFFKESNKSVKFNSLELFYETKSTHIINSQGVNLKKVLHQVMVEAIPSYNGDNLKVEVYKNYSYYDIDLLKIESDAKAAILDVTNRYFATKIPAINNVNIILKDNEVKEFMYSVIDNYSYADVYQHATDKKIGDLIQKSIHGDKLTIGLKSNSKANAFDGDGILLKPVTVIEKVVLVNHYGSNRYA